MMVGNFIYKQYNCRICLTRVESTIGAEQGEVLGPGIPSLTGKGFGEGTVLLRNF